MKKPSKTIILLVVLLICVALLVAFYALLMAAREDLNLDKLTTIIGIAVIGFVFVLVLIIIGAQLKSEKKAEKEEKEDKKDEDFVEAEVVDEEPAKEEPKQEEKPAKSPFTEDEIKALKRLAAASDSIIAHLNSLDEEEANVEDILAEAGAVKTSNTIINKKFVYDYIASQDYADKVELNNRPNYNSANWPIADAHYAIGLSKQCFIMVYETKNPTVLIIWNSEEYANELKKDHPNVSVSKVPKSKIPYYKLIMDDTYTEDQVKKIIDDSFAYAYKIAEVTPPEEEPIKEEPVAAPVEEEPVEEPKQIVIPEELQDDYIVENGIAYMIQRSYIVKVAGLDDTQKQFYSQVKNKILSYKGLRSKISFRWETFYYGREFIAKFQVRGKSITAFFALNEKDLEGTKYRVEKVENSKAYENVPYKFKFSSPRKTKYACEMVDLVIAKTDAKLDKKYKPVDYAKTLPSIKDKQKLIDEGLCKKVPTKKFMD